MQWFWSQCNVIPWPSTSWSWVPDHVKMTPVVECKLWPSPVCIKEKLIKYNKQEIGYNALLMPFFLFFYLGVSDWDNAIGTRITPPSISFSWNFICTMTPMTNPSSFERLVTLERNPLTKQMVRITREATWQKLQTIFPFSQRWADFAIPAQRNGHFNITK